MQETMPVSMQRHGNTKYRWGKKETRENGRENMDSNAGGEPLIAC